MGSRRQVCTRGSLLLPLTGALGARAASSHGKNMKSYLAGLQAAGVHECRHVRCCSAVPPARVRQQRPRVLQMRAQHLPFNRAATF